MEEEVEEEEEVKEEEEKGEEEEVKLVDNKSLFWQDVDLSVAAQFVP